MLLSGRVYPSSRHGCAPLIDVGPRVVALWELGDPDITPVTTRRETHLGHSDRIVAPCTTASTTALLCAPRLFQRLSLLETHIDVGLTRSKALRAPQQTRVAVLLETPMFLFNERFYLIPGMYYHSYLLQPIDSYKR